MKLLSISRSRSAWLCNVSDLNPKGISIYNIVVPLLLDVYKFKVFPSSNELPDETKGVKFESGDFKNSDGDIVSINFTIYSDGFVVETRSPTRSADEFLTEMLTKFSEEFNLPNYKKITINKQRLSQINVTTEKSLELINPKLKVISDYLATTVSGYGKSLFQLGGLAFWPEPINVINASPFSFERVVNKPFSENRYFSSAPLHTDQHLELLDKLEKILG